MVGCERTGSESSASGAKAASQNSPPFPERGPTEEEAEQLLRTSLEQVRDPMKILCFYDIRIEDLAGHKGLYFVKFDCEIEFLQDCYWMVGRLFTSTVPAPSRVARKRGDQERVSGTMVLRKTETGWDFAN
jgi:hypothetical protein